MMTHDFKVRVNTENFEYSVGATFNYKGENRSIVVKSTGEILIFD